MKNLFTNCTTLYSRLCLLFGIRFSIISIQSNSIYKILLFISWDSKKNASAIRNSGSGYHMAQLKQR